MTSNNNIIRLMIMYEDESVSILYADESRLHLSPCGAEFMLEKSVPLSAHPLQSGAKVRQRTRFTTSNYKDLMLGALEFRNKYAARPYLPEELIPDIKKQVCSSDSMVEWPACHTSLADVGSNGETSIHSVDGKASLVLSPSREEFFVRFMCRLSQNRPQRRESQEPEGSVTEHAQQDHQSSNSQIPFQKSNACANQRKPGERYLSTRLVQHHSVCGDTTVWRYPLSLALQLWSTQCPAERNKETAGETDEERRQTERLETTPGTYKRERTSHLPQALPVRCYNPHQHRWNFRDLHVHAKQEVDSDLPTELVKVLWCHGVVYRIVDGAVPVVEVSPGDGSVIRSNGVLASYFTHHRAGPGLVTDATYHLSSLPPDTPGQGYSVSSVVTRASRILNCYNLARHSLMHHFTPGCLNQDISSETKLLAQDVHIPESGYVNRPESEISRSNCVDEELKKIRRFNFLLENSHLLGAQMGSTVVDCGSGGSKENAAHYEPGSCTLSTDQHNQLHRDY
ncbi:hypothetical protein DPEC_G00122950 [Dallia pectoralis]|uniref:Uncharacterized protein n=1 Tax=Dallia pectoralis TaxID=75939 RepID=A0ACC2GQW4_DALPE|nr:hypothetical protein DPEC_G00122950 [Dallia pectoralis]